MIHDNVVTVEGVEEISPDEAAFRLSYGLEYDPDTDLIVGDHDNRRIRVTRHGDLWTIVHEGWHWVEDLGVDKIIQKVVDWIDALVNVIHRTSHGLVRDIKSGRMAEPGRVGDTKHGERFAKSPDSKYSPKDWSKGVVPDTEKLRMLEDMKPIEVDTSALGGQPKISSMKT